MSTERRSIKNTFRPLSRSTQWTPFKWRRIALRLRETLSAEDVGYLFGVHPMTVNRWQRER